MKVRMKAKMKNTLTPSPRVKQSALPDVSTVVQMDILVKTVLDHQSNVVNAILVLRRSQKDLL